MENHSRIIILGTANAIPDLTHENTHMLIEADNRIILIDCASNQLLRLQKAGVDFRNLSDIILTHFHPDHVAGLPQLLMNMWLLGYRETLTLYGLHSTLDRVEKMMELFGWTDWPDFFSVEFHRLPNEEMTPVLRTNEVTIFSSPVRHLIPTIGLRIEFSSINKIVAYSCDTEPCPQVIRLAQGASVLIHEASGLLLGHSSAAQAGEMASIACVDTLYLIHYPTGSNMRGELIQQAKEHFPGSVFLAEDYLIIPMNNLA